ELQDVVVSEDKPVAKLEAQIAGTPKPKVEWFKDNQKLEESSHLKMVNDGKDKYSLTILNVNSKDVGQYKILATNDLGKIESKAKISIGDGSKPDDAKKHSPEILKELQDVVVFEGQPVAKLEAQIAGNPKPKIEWFK
ncbi:hypothetical protein QR98_0005970, partial [Sarcoptes scabiei]